MIDDCYVIMNAKGIQRLTRTAPALRDDECAVRLVLDIPDDYMASPHPEVNVDIPHDAIIRPPITVVAEKP